MQKVKKPISIILSLLMLLSIFSVLPVTSNAKDTEKSKTGGVFPTITLAGVKDDETVLNWEGVVNENLPSGVSYDKSTETLTLDNADMLGTYGLEADYMGEDFKLEVKGDSSLKYIKMRGSCLNIIGDGKLTVGNSVKHAVYFEPLYDEYYSSALNIDESVSVKFSGSSSAVVFSKCSSDPDKVMTAGGKKVDGLKVDQEYQDGEAEKIKTALLEEDYNDNYLATVDSDPDGTYCVCSNYDDNDDLYYEVRKCKYNSELDSYVIDDSFESKIIDYYDFDNEESSCKFARDDEGDRIGISCYKYDYFESEVYQTEDGNTYAMYWWDVYDYSDDNVIEHNGEKYYVITRNYDLDEEDLTPVIDEVTVRYYDYSYDGTDYEYALSKRGRASGIYLDTDEGSLTLFEKFNKNCDSIEGISFDASTHNLSINDAEALNKLTGAKLAVYYMGDDFTIYVNCDCELGGITVYNGCLTLAGEGALTVNSTSDYGITVEPYEKDYNASSLKFADSVTVNAKGEKSAFCVKNTSLDKEKAVNVENLNQSNDTIIETDKKVSGAVLESWSDGIGYRYKVLKKDEPDSVYCARGYSTTYMDNYGKPSYTVTYYEMKKCHYDEKCDEYIIDESLGTLDQDEFDDEGFYLIEREYAGISPYITMSAYYVSCVEGIAYVDAEGKNFAVNGNNVYSYSEDKLITYNGNDVYLFERASDVDVNTLTKEKNKSGYRTFTYNGAEFTKEKVVETSEIVTNPIITEPVTTPEGETPITTEPTASSPEGETPITTEPDAVTPTRAPRPTKPPYVAPTNNDNKVSKKTNPIKVTVKTKTVKAKKLKKKAQKVKAITVKNAQGKVTYKLVKSGITKKIRKYVKINSKGVITIKKWKKAKKGTYKIKVTIKAAGNSAFNAKSVTKVIKVKIK